MSHKQAKHQRRREAQVDKEIKLLDTVIELTRQRDELLETLKDYVVQFGTRPQHGAECRCWQCRMHDDALDVVARSSPDER